MSQSTKPTRVKPAFYAWYYERMKEICKSYGYNLLLHGSMNRDLDLVAIPWTSELGDVNEMLKEVTKFLGGSLETKEVLGDAHFGPQGRLWYIINFQRAEQWNEYKDAQWYVDISVIPSMEKTLSVFAEWLYKKTYQVKGGAEELYWDQYTKEDHEGSLPTSKLVKFFLKDGVDTAVKETRSPKVIYEMIDPKMLKEVRESARLSLRDLAAETGVSIATLSRMENGHSVEYRHVKSVYDYLKPIIE